MGEFHGIGVALKILRGKTGLKQREVGERAGVTPAMISTYETDKAIPLIPTVESLLEAMGFNRFDLLNALEEANGRPRRVFLEASESSTGTHVLETLGVNGLSKPEQEVFLDTLRGVCHTLLLARRAQKAAAREEVPEATAQEDVPREDVPREDRQNEQEVASPEGF